MTNEEKELRNITNAIFAGIDFMGDYVKNMPTIEWTEKLVTIWKNFMETTYVNRAIDLFSEEDKAELKELLEN